MHYIYIYVHANKCNWVANSFQLAPACPVGFCQGPTIELRNVSHWAVNPGRLGTRGPVVHHPEPDFKNLGSSSQGTGMSNLDTAAAAHAAKRHGPLGLQATPSGDFDTTNSDAAARPQTYSAC